MKNNNLDPKLFKIHADFCAVLSNSTRLMIIWLLSDGTKSVSELANTLNLSFSNVSQHLRIMRDKGAVVFYKKGQKVYYQISNRKFINGLKTIRQGIIEQLHQNIKDVSETEKK